MLTQSTCFLIAQLTLAEEEELELSMPESSDADDEYGVTLRIVMDAFVNYLEQAIQQHRRVMRLNILTAYSDL